MSAARIAFFGTPEFALPTLEMLANHPQVELKLVCTQPDKPVGRGNKLTAPPAKQFALAHNIAVVQPTSLKGLTLITSEAGSNLLAGAAKKNSQLVAQLNANGPWDLFVCVAYGKLIPRPLLELARCGMVNIHPSLLPRWRGAAPLQRTISHGDTHSAVALMHMEEELDAGPVYCQQEFELAAMETLGTLHDKTAKIGAELLGRHLGEILDSTLCPQAQSTSGITYAPKWENQDLQISWTDSAEVTVRRIRASAPVPGARCNFRGNQVKIYAASVARDLNYPSVEVGTIVEVNRRELIVATGDKQYISLEELQLPGKKRLLTKELLMGYKIISGERFS